MGCHALPHHSLHPGQTDAILILQQFPYRTDTPVAKMVNIVVIPQPILQMNVVVDGRNDIFLGNMLGHQLVCIFLQSLRQLLRIMGKFLQNLCQQGVVYLFTNSKIPGITVHKAGEIHHHIGKNFYILFFRLNIYKGNGSILNSVRQLRTHLVTL